MIRRGDSVALNGVTYRLDELLSSGSNSYGEVWGATASNGDEVALKFVRFGRGDAVREAHLHEHFEREVLFLRSAAARHHRNIICMLDEGEVTLDNGMTRQVLVLERMDRSFLDVLVARGDPGSGNEPAVGLRVLLGIALQVIDGLRAVHEAGLVYRDLKADNILLRDGDAGEPIAKLSDFGTVRVDDPLANGSFAGSLPTMAPEQVIPASIETVNREGRLVDAPGYAVDARSDWYAVGLLLYRLVTGTSTKAQQELQMARESRGEIGSMAFSGQFGGLADSERERLWVGLGIDQGQGAAIQTGGTFLPSDDQLVGPVRLESLPAFAELVEALLARAPDARPDDADQIRKVVAAARDAFPEMTLPQPVPTTRAVSFRAWPVFVSALVFAGVWSGMHWFWPVVEQPAASTQGTMVAALDTPLASVVERATPVETAPVTDQGAGSPDVSLTTQPVGAATEPSEVAPHPEKAAGPAVKESIEAVPVSQVVAKQVVAKPAVEQPALVVAERERGVPARMPVPGAGSSDPVTASVAKPEPLTAGQTVSDEAPEAVVASAADESVEVDSPRQELSIGDVSIAETAEEIPAAIAVFPGLPVEKRREGANGIALTVLRGGEVQMGGAHGDPDELPIHARHVAPFYLATTEITWAQFSAFCVDSDLQLCDRHADHAGDMPVAGITWDEAQAFVAWLRERSGQPYELPSEAQYAWALRQSDTHEARGNLADRAFLKHLARPPRRQIFDDYDDGFTGASPVSSFAADELGLHGLNDNLSEWTADCAHHSYHGAPVDDRPWLDEGGCTYAVARGASYFSGPPEVRADNRLPLAKRSRLPTVGFRVALPMAAPVSKH